MRSSDRSFTVYTPIGSKRVNEGVNETVNEVETKLVLLCKTVNEGNSGGAKRCKRRSLFYPSSFTPFYPSSFPYRNSFSAPRHPMNIAAFNDSIAPCDFDGVGEFAGWGMSRAASRIATTGHHFEGTITGSGVNQNAPPH